MGNFKKDVDSAHPYLQDGSLSKVESNSHFFLLTGLVNDFCSDNSPFSFFIAFGNCRHIIRSISNSLSLEREFLGRLLSSKESGFQFFLGIADVGSMKKQHPNVMNYCRIFFRRSNFMLRNELISHFFSYSFARIKSFMNRFAIKFNRPSSGWPHYNVGKTPCFWVSIRQTGAISDFNVQ